MWKVLIVTFGVVLLVGTALAGGFVFDAYFKQPDDQAQTVSFEIEEGESVKTIGTRLQEQGVVDSLIFFKIYIRVSGTGGSFKPGTFDLKEGMNYRNIVRTLSQSEVEEVQITIPEGFTLKQIGERVRATFPHITEEEWNAWVSGASPLEKNSFIVAAKKPDDVDLEGYLFPDTYRFFPDVTGEEIVTKLVKTMSEKFDSSESFDPSDSISSIHDLLTLASIIEREVQSAEDMKIVAGIFLSRLEIGMPLQADSTISYYLGKTSAELTIDDLKTDEPFNTYTRVGLPPGPISNPGLNAIEAVVHPTETNYLYFLTADDGTVIYAATFDEHVANKWRYLR